MILGSHNSWSYLKPKKWWMKIFRFMAQCQDLDIVSQYNEGVRCFDLRIRFEGENVVVAHGKVVYDITGQQLHSILEWLNSKDNVKIRILHEIREKKQYTPENLQRFRNFCYLCETLYPKLKFWCGRNLVNYNIDYPFAYMPTCEEKYSSVCYPKLIDDWYPRWYAKHHNKQILEKGTDKEILLIDFINYN